MKKGAIPDNSVKVDMTPMIDCVFNLLVFFILVVDLSQAELEKITLPRASEFIKDDANEKGRKIVNLDIEGVIKVKRRPFSLDQLRTDLKVWSDMHPREAPYGLCTKPILIRTDRGTEMKHVQKIMQLCGEKPLGIYKVELACSEDSPGIWATETPGKKGFEQAE
jgi:biopolymer transport protein ExbD